MAASESSSAKKKRSNEKDIRHTTRDVAYGDRRNALREYLDDPANHSSVLGYNDDFVVIRDLYPKSTVHLLILPRDQVKQRQRMSEACYDADFFTKLKSEAVKWRTLAGKELARQLLSTTDVTSESSWNTEIKVGVHSAPSMNHLHIHVLSRDMRSPYLRHKKHYNSFTTPFFVDLEAFPLSDDNAQARMRDWHKRDMICWRCNRNFENKFTQLKEHLQHEFQAWRDDLIISLNKAST
jgi:aprataxin